MASPQAPVLIVEHGADAGLGWFGEWLPQAGVEPVIVRPYAGEMVPGTADYAGLVVLGGEPGARDDDRAPWLPATRELLRRAVDDRVPALGICLGAQLLAVACGGDVERAGSGPEVGACRVKLEPAAAADPLLGGLPETSYAVQWHHDAVTRLPAGAELLARGETYPHQAFRVGELAWGVQFHPEATPAAVASWADHDAARLRAHDIDPAAVVQAVGSQAGELAAVWRGLAVRFAGLCRRS